MRPALPRFALLRWTRALAAWLMISCARRAAEPLSFYVNYAATVPTAPLVAHPLSNVHPDARVHLAAAQAAANTIPTYPSVGEMAGGAPYRGAARARGLPLAGRNTTRNSDLFDLTDPRWAEFFVNDLAAPAVRRGFDGLFLDTADSVDRVAPANPARTAALRAGLVAAVRRLRAAHPTAKIVINRGFFAFDELRDTIDGVLADERWWGVGFTAAAGLGAAVAGH